MKINNKKRDKIQLVMWISIATLKLLKEPLVFLKMKKKKKKEFIKALFTF